MAEAQDRRQRQRREDRLPIVAELYRKGHSYRSIREQVMDQLGLKTYSLRTVKNDVDKLIQEWKDDRVEKIDELRTTQRARLEYIMTQAFDQWEKSKEDYTAKEIKQKGSLDKGSDERINTKSVEQTKKEMVRYGNPSYLTEARGAIAEINKLYGVYAPEKKEISGELSFTEFLMSSDVVDEEE